MSPFLTPLLLACLLLALLTALWLLWPLRGGAADAGQSPRALGLRVYRERLDELNADHMHSRIDADTYAALKLELDRSLLADNAGPAAAGPDRVRSRRGLALAVLVLLPALSLGLYLGCFLNPHVATDLRNQAELTAPLERMLAGEPPGPEAERHSLPEFMRVLQRRVQADPSDADGWYALGMGFMQAQEPGPARGALARAAELRPDDEQIVLSYAQASILTQQGDMDPTVRGLLGRILSRQPDHQGALLMLGVGSLRAGDRATALAALEQLQVLRAAHPGTQADDDAANQRIAMLIAEARQDPAAGISGRRIEVEVALAPELARAIPADATLFVFARALQGPPMPVAALRRAVGEFPLRVTLSDADNLSSDRPLSQEGALVVSARISRSGSATPASGDWEAVGVPVEKDSQGLVRLRIGQIRP